MLGESLENARNPISDYESYLKSLDETSQQKYYSTLNKFKAYCDQKNEESRTTSSTVLGYLNYLKNEMNYAPNTITSKFSIINGYLKYIHGIDYDNFPVIKKTLKNWNKNYTPEKAKDFSKEEYAKFLTEAPNSEEYLPMKVPSY